VGTQIDKRCHMFEWRARLARPPRLIRSAE
jgi:hypothetical protein